MLLLIPGLLVAESWSGMNLHALGTFHLMTRIEVTAKEDHVTFAQSPSQLSLASLERPSPQLQHIQYHHSLPAISTSVDSPPSSPPSESVHSRIKAFCDYNFRTHDWYLTNLYFALCCLTSLAPLVLLQAAFVGVGASLIVYFWTAIAGAWVVLMVIPMYEILNSLEQTKANKRRWRQRMLQLFTDQSRGFRIFRYLCYLICIVCSVLGSIIYVRTPDQFAGVPVLFLIYFAPGVYIVTFVLTLMFVAVSVLRQVLIGG